MRTTLRVLIPSLLLLTWTFAVQAAQPLRVGLSGNYLPLHGIEGGRLVVKAAGAAYQALIVPDMSAVRWATIEKAAQLLPGAP